MPRYVDELRYDLGVRLSPERDGRCLGWTLDQLLYWELSGVLAARGVEDPPDLASERFLAARTEDGLMGIEDLLETSRLAGTGPRLAHPVVRRVADGHRRRTWPSYVFFQLALGEALALSVLATLSAAVDPERLAERLKGLLERKEGHVRFGEGRTLDLLQARPRLRHRYLGGTILTMTRLRALSVALETLPAEQDALHLGLSGLAAHLEKVAEARLRDLGLVSVSLDEMGLLGQGFEVGGYLAESVLREIARVPRRLLPFGTRPTWITDRYMDDPLIRRYLLTVVGGAGHEAA